MKLILLQHLSGTNGVKAIGDEIIVNDTQAIAFLQKGIAKCKTQKEQKEFLSKIEAQKQEQILKEQKASAILYENELKEERLRLLSRIDEIDIILGNKEE